MKKNIALIFAIIAWFAVIMQFYLMMENRVASVPETIVRFFSFFTILTNTLVAVYFTVQCMAKNQKSFWQQPGTLTAITVYILVVGLVYQLVLRQIWEPEGMQKVVDELLHSVNPVLVLIFWFIYEKKNNIRWNQLPYWLLYPLIYLVYILGRGHLSDFYPYPFVNVAELGMQQVLVNSFFLLLVFLGLSAGLVWVGKRTSKKQIGGL
ncbi:Pr6Pr family membrane protein [Aquiflexum sp.]|uniref:Pr6Pr family membrane protein n=1 Tax=Aquiflexum sp. TaxID=1872584 RepID=UPI0035946F9C